MSEQQTTMRVSLRESRMVLERLMQVACVPEGMVGSVRDCALYSAALGLGGFAGLDSNIAAMRGAGELRPCHLMSNGKPVFDGAGQHAWMVADALLDVLIDTVGSSGVAELSVAGVVAPEELGVLAALGQKYGVSIALNVGKDGGTVRVGPASAEPSVLDRIRRDGIPVDSSLWWDLFHRSSDALAADTVQSRRHAGPIRVEDDGRIVGRQDDDETDFSLLTGDVRPKKNAFSS